PAISMTTSTSSRSAPRPARRLARAISTDGAWATLAPPSIAILVAVLSWPSSAPIMSRRILASLLWLDDFGHGLAELAVYPRDLAACDVLLSDDYFYRFADRAI